MEQTEVIKAATTLLETIEGKPLRPELLETPYRVYKALEEMLDGYQTDIGQIFKTFDGEGQDQLVILREHGFSSICEHHLLPFIGIAHVGYLPLGKVIGISKIARLVTAFAHRLQLQERITKQVAYSLMENLQPKGVAVVTEAKHLCLACRGPKSTGELICSEMLGEFREDKMLRQEFLSLIRK